MAKQLSDLPGECRAHGNLGSAYFSKGNYKEALTSHRYQLVLAMKCKDSLAATSALTSLGHVYTATGDYPNALASHKQVSALKEQEVCRPHSHGERFCQRVLKSRNLLFPIPRVFSYYTECIMKVTKHDIEFDTHIPFPQCLELVRQQIGDKILEAREVGNVGAVHLASGDFDKAVECHLEHLQIAVNAGNKVSFN